MTPGQAKHALHRQLVHHGEKMVLRRPNFPSGPATDVLGLGRAVQFTSSDLVGSIVETDRKIILYAPDFSTFPLPIKENSDRLLIGGVPCVIKSVNTTTRRIAGQTIGIELIVSGSSAVSVTTP